MPSDYRAEGVDFRASDLADFYNECERQGVSLNPAEEAVLTDLIDKGVLVRNESGYTAPDIVAVIGIHRDLLNRKTVFQHEYAHGLFFVDPVFQYEVMNAWETLPPSTQTFLRGILVLNGYESEESWLLATETQAYAIAPTLDKDNVTGLILDLYRIDPSSLSWADLGREDIRDFLKDLHNRYTSISESRIPFLLDDAASVSKKLDPGPLPALLDKGALKAGSTGLSLKNEGMLPKMAVLTSLQTYSSDRDVLDHVQSLLLMNYYQASPLNYCEE